MPKVIITTTVAHNGHILKKGAIHDLPRKSAESLLDSGHADPYEEPPKAPQQQQQQQPPPPPQ